MDSFVFTGKVTFSRAAWEDREQWLSCNIAVRAGSRAPSIRSDSGAITFVSGRILAQRLTAA
jgi:hypothetical protein